MQKKESMHYSTEGKKSKVSNKSQKIIEKRFLKKFNSTLESLELSKKPNQELAYKDYIDLLTAFIFEKSSNRMNVAERDDVYEVWRLLKGHTEGLVLKHSL